jgi:hypothetical protein
MSSNMLEWIRVTPLSEVAPGVWYPGYMVGLPDLYVSRLPPALTPRNNGSAVNKAHWVTFVENDFDRRLVEQSLHLPLTVTAGGVIDFRPTIDRVNAKPSTSPRSDMAVLLYMPPAPGRPWFVIMKIPSNTRGHDLCRLRYGSDGFATEREALDHMARLAALTSAPGCLPPIISPDRSIMS